MDDQEGLLLAGDGKQTKSCHRSAHHTLWPFLVATTAAYYLASTGFFVGRKHLRQPEILPTTPFSERASPLDSPHWDYYFNADGIVTGANQETVDLSYLLSCWEANNLTLEQNASVQFHEFDVQNYGAVGDGQTLNTRAFQEALDAAANPILSPSDIRYQRDKHNQTNLGIVVVRNGIYNVGGAIDLYNYTFLYVDSSAVVVGSAKEEDFPYPDAWESEGNPLFPGGILPILVRAKHQHHLGLFGRGSLDGGALPGYIQGFNASLDKFEPMRFRQSGVDPPCHGECRPQLVLLGDCHTVIVQDITLQNSPDWTLHIRGSSNVILTRLHVYGDWRWPNNDGIDVDSSHSVTVSHSKIETADDAICIKTTKGYGAANNLLIHDNLLKSRSSAFKIGSSTEENVFNVLVDNVTIQSGSNRAIAIQHRDGGTIFNIHIRNIVIESTELQPQHWWGTGEPIYITSTPRFSKDWPLGRVVNITVQHVRAYSVAGTSFVAYRPAPAPDSMSDQNNNNKSAILNSTISNVAFLDVQICMGARPGSGSDPSGRILYERPSRDFRPTDLEPELDTYPADEEIGFFLDHIQGEQRGVEEMQTETSGVWFYRSAIFFPPFEERQGREQASVSRTHTIAQRTKNITQHCLETHGLERSITGLECHIGRVCFP